MRFGTWALRWRHRPVEPCRLQERLGHSNTRAAMLYQHSSDERQADIAAAMSVIAESAK